MKLRFIEYGGEILVVVGVTYIKKQDPPESYVAIYLRDSIIRTALRPDTVNVPFSQAVEITDPKRIKALLVLYGK